MKYMAKIQFQGDIYLCLFAGVVMVIHAFLSSLGLLLPETIFDVVSLVIGIGLLVLPGYILSLLIGLDRSGIATLAGVAVALSLAVLALSGTIVWLGTHSFSVPLLELMVASWTIILSVATLHHRSQSSSDSSMTVRWQALGLMIIPLVITLMTLVLPLPISPAMEYTEFFVIETKAKVSRPIVNVAIVNAERQAETYYIVADSGSTQIRSKPIKVSSGAKWEGFTTVPDSATGKVRLYLYKSSEELPSHTLHIWLDSNNAERNTPTSTSKPTNSPVASPTRMVAATDTPTARATPSPTATVRITKTPTAKATPLPTKTVRITNTPTARRTPSATPTITVTNTPHMPTNRYIKPE